MSIYLGFLLMKTYLNRSKSLSTILEHNRIQTKVMHIMHDFIPVNEVLLLEYFISCH